MHSSRTLHCRFLMVVALAIGLLVSSGCRKYTEVRSEEGLTIVRALYTACSSRNLQRLTAVETRILAALENGDIREDEADDFLAIIRQAQSGDWDKAIRESYRYAQDQVRAW